MSVNIQVQPFLQFLLDLLGSTFLWCFDSVFTQNMRFHSRERLFEVVGFDAADVVRRGCVQGLHEQLQRTAKLNQTQVREKHHVVPQGGARPCRLTWCPTVFR